MILPYVYEPRITRDQWAYRLAAVTALRSTCLRRAVGCVLLDIHGFVLATGYNGRATGLPHCNEQTHWRDTLFDSPRPVYAHACAGATAASGTNLDACEAIHAEQNALLRCADVRRIDTCYVTASPCVTCVKLLLNTGCQRVVYGVEYPAPEAFRIWTDARRAIHQIDHSEIHV